MRRGSASGSAGCGAPAGPLPSAQRAGLPGHGLRSAPLPGFVTPGPAGAVGAPAAETQRSGEVCPQPAAAVGLVPGRCWVCWRCPQLPPGREGPAVPGPAGGGAGPPSARDLKFPLSADAGPPGVWSSVRKVAQFDP